MASAQASLDAARSDLDAAVGSLGEPKGDSVMANPDIVALLFRVVAARRHLEDVTRPSSMLPSL